MMNTNLLDLNNDILNIIGDFVKKDNAKRQIMNEKQIINGKEIRFCLYPYWSLYGIKDGDTYSKYILKKYLFYKIDNDIKYIKAQARVDKIKLTKTDIRLCIWICFQRYKLILNNDYKINIYDDENNYFDEYLTLNKLNLKSKKYSFNY
jgi:hypothetical protein